jgi:iron complex transport system substrate-binding protein
MNSRRRRPFVRFHVLVASALAAAAILAACGDDAVESTATPAVGGGTPLASSTVAAAPTAAPTETPAASRPAYTYPEYDGDLPIFTVVSETDTGRVVRDAWEEVTIPKEPQRVFVLDELALDIMLGIGMKPVGVVGDPERQVSRFFEGRMDGVEVLAGWEPDFEAILALEPDLIVSMFGWPNEFRDKLSRIAPTLISHEGAFPFWRQATLDLAAVLGQPEAGERLLAEYDAAVQAAREQLPLGLREGSESLAVVQVRQNGIRVYGVGFERDGSFYPTNMTQTAYADLRLTPPEFVHDLSQLDPGGGYREVSLELLGQVDSDHLVLVVFDPDRAAEVESNAVFKAMPAVKLGNVYRLSSDSVSLGPVNMMKRLEEFIQILTAS